MAAIDPGIRDDQRVQSLLRRGTRLAVVGTYLAAAVVALILVRPAFQDETGPVVVHSAPPATDVIRKRESVAVFAARHGLDLGELLALNPRIDSLDLPPGTKLRVG